MIINIIIMILKLLKWYKSFINGCIIEDEAYNIYETIWIHLVKHSDQTNNKY